MCHLPTKWSCRGRVKEKRRKLGVKDEEERTVGKEDRVTRGMGDKLS